MKSRNLFIIAATIVAGLVALFVFYTLFHRIRTAPLSKAPAHGTSFLVEAVFPETGGGTNELAALKQAMLARASRLGVRVFWEPVSATRARVTAPISDANQAEFARKAMCRGGRLEIRLVHEDSARLVERGETPLGYEVLQHSSRLPNGRELVERLVVKQSAAPGLSGSVIQDAIVTRNGSGSVNIGFRMRPAAAEAFATFTRENIDRRAAIIVDGQLMSAPVIRGPIEGGSGVITGSMDPREAHELASALDCPLPFPVKLVEWKDF